MASTSLKALKARTSGAQEAPKDSSAHANHRALKPLPKWELGATWRWVRCHSLTITMLGFFLLFFLGQVATGFLEYNKERVEHQEAAISFGRYLGSGHLWEATGENWESEFLQMAAYILFTSFLIQKGSSESRRSAAKERKEAKQDLRKDPSIPWPVRRGGWVKKIYAYSLTLALFILFLMSFTIHAIGGLKEFNEERRSHGEAGASMSDYLGSSRFWFESFQNWQSEFLAVGVLVILSIYLRQKGSPESKPVESPHSKTGEG